MNSCYSFLKDYMRKYPMTIAWRIKSHSRIIDKFLNPDENILYAFAGQKNDSSINIFNTYVIVFTNKRFIVATKRVLFGYFFKSITPDMYNDLTIHRGLVWGRITLDTVKEVITITNIDVAALDEIETNITEVVLKQKKDFGVVRNSKGAKK